MKVVKSLDFLKVAKPISEGCAELLDELREAAEEVHLHKQGEIKLKTVQELLDEF